jgi:serine/threonine-protein kinase
MGRVYRALVRGPAGFEKTVALKTVSPELAEEPEFVEMFLDEARIAARIDHPNVCRVFDFGLADGRYFIAMEFLVGAPVSQVLRRLKNRARTSDIDDVVVRIVAEACEGLHAAHELTDEKGQLLHVVHRDVSPQNLFVTFDGGVRIVDFGVATARGRLHRTTSGALKGKLAYMAPEAIRREEIDRRADVWGLGAVLFELLAGKRLVSGATEVDLILSITQGQLGSLREARPDLDPALVEIVQRALSPREGRFATARELGIALQRWLAMRGTPTGMVEVAAFMEGLFPSESGRGAPPTVRTRHARAERAEKARDEAAAPTSFDVQVDVDSAVLSAGVDSTEVRRTRRGWALGAAASMVVIGSGIGWALWPGEAPDVPSVAGDPAIVRASESASESGTVTETGTATEVATATESETRTETETATETETETATQVATETAPAIETATAAESETATDTGSGAARPVRGDGRARPSREREVTEGELHVATPGGWADVHVDGRRVGRTPLSLTLPAGTARVELRPFGFAPPSGDSSLRRSVRIGARPTRLSVRLDP